MQNVHFSPPDLAPLFGVNVSTIKRWIDRGLLPAAVTSGGHRRVTKQGLTEFLRRYPKYRKESYTLARLLTTDINPRTNWNDYYQALQKTTSDTAEKIIERLFLRRVPMEVILEDVVSVTLEKIGAEWARGRLSIYEEHRMTFLIRSHLVKLQQFVEGRAGQRRVALLACVEKETHEIGLQMLSLILLAQGWRVHTLGITTPPIEVIRAAKALHPNLVCITKVYDKSGSLDYLNTIARYCSAHAIRLAFGGRGWSKVIRERRWPGRQIQYYQSLRQFARDVR